LRRRLGADGVYLRTGDFVFHVRSSLPQVAQGLQALYDQRSFLEHSDFSDFHVTLHAPGVRRWVRPQCVFRLDERTPFKPLPLEQAFAMFEWGLNWCISSHAHQFLILHAAVVERGGRAAVLAAPPGAGKSTLTAALVSRGWRLFTDELALIHIETGRVHPLPRPIGLKNASIDIIGKFAPQAVIGPIARDTVKGTVAHMRPPAESFDRMREAARAAWLIFPKWVAHAPATMNRVPKGQAFMRLAEQAFNYSVLGQAGFETMATLIDACDCFEFTYGDLGEAISAFAQLEST